MLPKKPKREDYGHDFIFIAAERDYYKALSEYAVAELEYVFDYGYDRSRVGKAIYAIRQTEVPT